MLKWYGRSPRQLIVSDLSGQRRNGPRCRGHAQGHVDVVTRIVLEVLIDVMSSVHNETTAPLTARPANDAPLTTIRPETTVCAGEGSSAETAITRPTTCEAAHSLSARITAR
jgi:hypothetical protein